MSDYIKREDAERLLRYYFLSALTEDERVDELNRIPSADVVEVVRCKDCIHNGLFDTDCPLRTWVKGINDYCSYGERK